MFKAHKIAAASQGLWDAAERLGSSVERMTGERLERIERPAPVLAVVCQLNDAAWPPCETCGLGVNKCQCGDNS